LEVVGGGATTGGRCSMVGEGAEWAVFCRGGGGHGWAFFLRAFLLEEFLLGLRDM